MRHRRLVLSEEDLEGACAVTTLEHLDERRPRGEPVSDVLERRLQVTLDRVRDRADAERLVLEARRPGQAYRPGGQLERVRMPLEHLEIEREAAEDRVSLRRLAQEDGVHAELGLGALEDPSPERGREELRPE